MQNPDWSEIAEVLTRAQIAERLEGLHEQGEILRSYLEIDLFESPRERSEAPPPWLIGLSKQFKKDSAALDRKLLGRVLELLSELSELPYPFKTHGDTFKPLKGELEGCWRYRIGDSRLIIQPKPQESQINVLALGARGGVYD
jgi:mRNA interferase RelE/StbE